MIQNMPNSYRNRAQHLRMRVSLSSDDRICPVIVAVAFKVRRMLAEIRIQKHHDSDVYSVIKNASTKVLANERVGKILATEIAMIYFGLFLWKKDRRSTLRRNNDIIYSLSFF